MVYWIQGGNTHTQRISCSVRRSPQSIRHFFVPCVSSSTLKCRLTIVSSTPCAHDLRGRLVFPLPDEVQCQIFVGHLVLFNLFKCQYHNFQFCQLCRHFYFSFRYLEVLEPGYSANLPDSVRF